jgi:hypothetical protein
LVLVSALAACGGTLAAIWYLIDSRAHAASRTRRQCHSCA